MTRTNKNQKSDSFIPDHHRMLRPQATYLNSVLDEMDGYPADRILYGHIVKSYEFQAHRYQDGIPIPYETIRRDTPGANPFRLRNVLEIGGYWKGHCREYRPLDSIMTEYLAISSRLSLKQLIATDSISWETGRVMNRPPRSRLYDENRNAQPPMVRAAIERLTNNGAFVMLDELEAEYQRFASAIAAMGASVDSKAKGRFKNDTSCREWLSRYKPSSVGNGLYTYTPAWYAVSTGRLHIVGGCLQSASGDMKRAGYLSMPGFRNYDVKSSQVFITGALVQNAGLDAQPLIDYYQTEDYKRVYGDAIGIPGAVAKRLVIALCMGALLPKSIKDWQARDNSILNILAGLTTDEAQLEQLLKQSWEVLGPIARCLKHWHTYLLQTYIPENKIKGGRGYVLPNAVGKFLSLFDLRLDHPRYRWVDVARIAAHLLQGYEAACIQEQIVRDERCNIISCEHDGFISNEGQADQSLWAEITAKHGLAGMKLEEKPL